ncbi:hypothetical protein [Pasteuria penetrans]|uniref:hypothetical protein n=1 Tax=Pasteuria penetrans TaxID=86005 RepID=UPI00165A4753|nr:hypothetical protein [Pasteuria penetrans]
MRDSAEMPGLLDRKKYKKLGSRRKARRRIQYIRGKYGDLFRPLARIRSKDGAIRAA